MPKMKTSFDTMFFLTEDGERLFVVNSRTHTYGQAQNLVKQQRGGRRTRYAPNSDGLSADSEH